MSDSLQLRDVFPPTSMEQWRAVVQRDLKGGDFERRLVRTTLDGLRIEPLYSGPVEDGAGAAGQEPWVRGSRSEPSAWRMAQLVRHPLLDDAIAEVVEEFAGGATGVRLRIGRDRGGITVPDARALQALLDAVPDGGGVSLDAGARAHEVLAWLASLAPRGPLEVNLDPLGTLAADGFAPSDAQGALDSAVGAAAEAPGDLRVLACSALATHRAGATDVEALGWLLSQGAEWLRAAERTGTDLSEVARRLVFHVPVGTEVFRTIALIRALRACWGRMLSACGVRGTALVHAHPAARCFTRRDPWVNMLRNTVAVAGAGMGGAEVITSTPFDAALGLPETLGRRVARNTHHLLLDESHLAEVLDPAGGSWFAEELTRQLARNAWEHMQACEAAGGLARALIEGDVARACAASWERARLDVARRKTPITGVSMFPLANEALLERVPHPALPADSRALPRHRLAEEWEVLRDAADAAPERPVAVLLQLGELAEHSARLTWTENLMLAGGLEVIRLEAGQAVVDSPAVVVLVGADARHGEEAVSCARALSAAGKRVWLAGRPRAHEAALTEAGVSGVLHAGQDVLGALTELLRSEGVLS